MMFFCVFFFQAEDGIRDKLVTGVQTCALPICFTDAFDVPRLRRLLERIHDGELWTRHVDTPLPSPFVYPLLLAWDWAYLGAGHAEERRSDAVVMRKAWSVTAGPLRAEIVATVEAELQKTTPERRGRGPHQRGRHPPDPRALPESGRGHLSTPQPTLSPISSS